MKFIHWIVNLPLNHKFSWKNCFEGEAGSFLDFAKSYKKFGLNIDNEGNIEYREWAPAAKELSIVSKNIVFNIDLYYLYKCSLETSTDGIEIHISAREMITEYGLS